MPAAYKFADALGLYLTGGASNADPDASLGGVRGSTEHRGMGFIVKTPIPALRVDNVFPACGEGTAYVRVGSDGETLYFTPPDGVEGEGTPIQEGESRFLQGDDESKGTRVTWESGYTLPANTRMEIKLVNPINGVLGQANLTSAQRVAGRTTYRALMLHCHGIFVQSLKLWMPAVGGAQATFALGVEDSVAGAIQTIANETTAPSGVVFSTPTTEGAALNVGNLGFGEMKGLWIRRVFPAAGVVSLRQNFQLTAKYSGG